MPNLQAQFQTDSDAPEATIEDLKEAFMIMNNDLMAIAVGAVRPNEARGYASESLKAINMLFKPKVKLG